MPKSLEEIDEMISRADLTDNADLAEEAIKELEAAKGEEELKQMLVDDALIIIQDIRGYNGAGVPEYIEGLKVKFPHLKDPAKTVH